jgi:hypothetical protein
MGGDIRFHLLLKSTTKNSSGNARLKPESSFEKQILAFLSLAAFGQQGGRLRRRAPGTAIHFDTGRFLA